MKFRNLLQLVFFLIAGQLMFSCSSAKYYEFAASKQAPYKVTKQKATPEQVVEENMNLTTVALAAAIEKEAAKSEPVLEASIAPLATTVKTPKAINQITAEEVSTPAITEAEALALANERIKNMTKTEKRDLKKEMKEVLKQDRRGGSASIVEIILAILLPPLAVFLHEGITTRFWISILLTLLGWLPGVIFALLIVTDTI